MKRIDILNQQARERGIDEGSIQRVDSEMRRDYPEWCNEELSDADAAAFAKRSQRLAEIHYECLNN